eukprot:CAMPEP_0114675096 /NCGR_PEP_ID=MMETSP0191-20121206/47394_1 /TAXON_ID=126664 /ORGANISM="Sorites sp." /LENGTH=100 /DNA_ID=CAMNT_0001943753 /DNA_START=22 /DNA_END=320 /DNA_ORIENTATION=-
MAWKAAMSLKQAMVRCAPVVRFKIKVFCPECGLRVQPSDVGEVRVMRDVCKTMWRKFMQLDDRHCPLFRTCEVNDLGVTSIQGHRAPPSLWRPMPRLKGR